MVTKVWRALDDGILVPLQVGNNVDDWCQRMFRDGTYVDLTFFEMSASVLDSDIAVVSLHGNASSCCHVIRAGLLDGRHSQATGKNVPIFVGYFKDFRVSRHTEILKFSTWSRMMVVLMLLSNLTIAGLLYSHETPKKLGYLYV